MVELAVLELVLKVTEDSPSFPGLKVIIRGLGHGELGVHSVGVAACKIVGERTVGQSIYRDDHRGDAARFTGDC